MRRLAFVVVLMTACSSVVPRAATVTPSQMAVSRHASLSPIPARSDFLAIVAGAKNTYVSLVASDGTLVAAVPVRQPTFRAHALMSWTSASRTRLYYLDGYEVRFLAPDGTTGLATRIFLDFLNVTEQAGFAVSPDDSRIAVAVFTYKTPSVPGPPIDAVYTGMRLYVEDLNGGAHHVDIFSSTTVAEFPIGWVNGNLIIAVSSARCCPTQQLNPYGAKFYQVVDPATGRTLVAPCTGLPEGYGYEEPAGPVSAGGVLCFAGNNTRFERWDGVTVPGTSTLPEIRDYLAALAPDGGLVAAGGVDVIRIWNGYSDAFCPSAKGWVYGWLDTSHVVYGNANGSTLSVCDLPTGQSTEIAPAGYYLGTFPAAVT